MSNLQFFPYLKHFKAVQQFFQIFCEKSDAASPGAAAPSVSGESCGGPRCTPGTETDETETKRTSKGPSKSSNDQVRHLSQAKSCKVCTDHFDTDS